MDWRLTLEFLVLLGAIAMGARAGGVGLGLWGAMGLLVLILGFDIPPANIPGEVLLIVFTVIMAASAMEVAGGIDFLVRVAERIIRKNPKQITIVAPLVTYRFTAGDHGKSGFRRDGGHDRLASSTSHRAAADSYDLRAIYTDRRVHRLA